MTESVSRRRRHPGRVSLVASATVFLEHPTEHVVERVAWFLELVELLPGVVFDFHRGGVVTATHICRMYIYTYITHPIVNGCRSFTNSFNTQVYEYTYDE